MLTLLFVTVFDAQDKELIERSQEARRRVEGY